MSTLKHSTNDPTASSRKQDHLDLAIKSQTGASTCDSRFEYEPMLAGHPSTQISPQTFLGKEMRHPLWISSMTGGTQEAYTINQNLARLCGNLGLGMGLGSCRSILESDDRLKDFDVRDLVGENQSLFANLGIAQCEILVDNGKFDLIATLLKKLRADGLIIHVNPMQEWLQPEGDHIKNPPIDTIKRILDKLGTKIIVKEVGQGIGPRSLTALAQLPLAAIDLAGYGGTNFATLELLREEKHEHSDYSPLANLGHPTLEMIDYLNHLRVELGSSFVCKEIIISGGIRNFLDGYYAMEKLKMPSIYGQASAFLKRARTSYEVLEKYATAQIEGLRLAQTFLRVKE